MRLQGPMVRVKWRVTLAATEIGISLRITPCKMVKNQEQFTHR